MSSILEALEKADEERGLHPKALKSVSSGKKQRRLNPRLVVVAIALIVVVNAIVWFLFLRNEPVFEKETKSVAEIKTSVVKPESSTAEEIRSSGSKAVAKPVVSVPEQLKRTTLPSAKPLIEEAMVKKSQSRATPVRSVAEPLSSQDGVKEMARVPPVEAAKPVAQKAPQTGVRKLPEPVAKAATQSRIPKPRVVMAPPPEVLQAEPLVSEPADSEAEQIPLVWELPQNLRERVLQLQSSIHVYSETPEERFVIINMKRYQEGDSLTADGFRLERIERKGIVIDYGGGLVRLEQR